MALQDHLTLLWVLAQWSISCLQSCSLYLNSPSSGLKSIRNSLVTHPIELPTCWFWAWQAHSSIYGLQSTHVVSSSIFHPHPWPKHFYIQVFVYVVPSFWTLPTIRSDENPTTSPKPFSSVHWTHLVTRLLAFGCDILPFKPCTDLSILLQGNLGERYILYMSTPTWV